MGRTSDARDRLIESASELIHSGGFGNAGVQEICDRAGVKKGSFYHFFPSKVDLALTVIDVLDGQVRDLFRQALASDLPPLARIERLFSILAGIQDSHRTTDGHLKGCPFGNLSLEMSGRDERIRAKLDDVLSGGVARLADVIEEAQRQGEVRAIDAPGAALAIFSLLEGAILMAKTRNDPKLIAGMGPAAVAMIRQLGT